MRIASTQLPPLPKVPNEGKGRLVADISFTGPDTVETRLGSIPADYESWTGWERRDRIYFRDGNREASNPYGRSQDIWRGQPTYNADGTPRMSEKVETIVAEPKSTLTTPLKWGVGGAALGGLMGAAVGVFAGFSPGVGASAGAAVGGIAGGLYGYQDANTDRVRLEWQETNVNDHELVGYIHDVTEDREYVCRGHGDNRDCRWETDDYEHDFYPIVEKDVVGTYYRPVVVHYKES